MTTLAQRVGHRLKVRRVTVNLTQTALAKAVGIDQSQVSQLERGKIRMDLDLLERIAQALKCTLIDLLDGDKQAA